MRKPIFPLLSALVLCVACARQSTDGADARVPPTKAAVTEPSTVPCRDSLLVVITAPHDVPAAADARSACREPTAALIEIATDESQPAFPRLRATALLGEFNSAESTRTLTTLAARGKLASLRRTALVALGQHPPSAESIHALRTALKDDDAHVRGAAAGALSTRRSAAVQEALAHALETERVPFVRKKLENALRRR